ncbi:ATP-binding protein [Aquiflexum sp.]|uniref:tetratricopeptide repeat-containing sensor histidine kinase n=1 Tax=Aquiflexum sp. TaxID=1872584 RepID=UPI0035932027
MEKIRYLFRVFSVMALTGGVSQVGFAQDADSLILQKASKAFELASANSDSAYFLAKDALGEAQKLSFKRGEANSFNALGWVLMHKGQLDSSLLYLNKSRLLFMEESSTYDIARVNINLTEVLTKQSRFGEALYFALEADSLSTKLQDLPLQTDTKRLLGILYREQGDIDLSVDYFKQAISGFERQGDIRRSVNTAISLSILLRKINLADSSLSVLKKCLALIEGSENNEYQLAMVNEHMGDSYFLKGEYQEALGHYILSFNLFGKLGNMADVAYEAMVVGKTHIALQQYPQAEYFLNSALRIADSLDFVSYQFDASSELASLYKETGQWQKAYAHLNHSLVLKEKLEQQKQVQILAELKEKYESEKKEQEIALLKSNVELENVIARRRLQFQYFTFFLFLFSLALAYLTFNRYRLKQKLNEQVLRNQIASDLHDEIGSTLSSIDVNSRIALLKVDETETVAKQLEKIQLNTRSIMDNLAHIVWSINPNNDSLEKLVYRMKDFAAEILEPLGIQYSFNHEDISPEFILNPILRKNIYLIFKEAVNNCVKYSMASEVEITTVFKDKNLLVKIEDNGKGFDLEKAMDKGNGLGNMKDRTGQIGGKLSIRSNQEIGTLISLEVPIT